MKNTKNTQNIQTKHSRIPLFITIFGALLTFGWAWAIAAWQLHYTLACVINPFDCSLYSDAVTIAFYAPFIIGSILLPIGLIKITYVNDFSMTLKVGIAIITGVVVYVSCIYLTLIFRYWLHSTLI
jgi:hypothetical protein